MLQPDEPIERVRSSSLNERDSTAKTNVTLPLWNTVIGSITAIHQGLTRTGVHLHIGERVTLRSRWPSDLTDAHTVRIGQRVVAQIAADAVMLAAPGKWPGKDRWNRWNGRIVLVEPGTPFGPITVKLQGEQWTLKSLRLVLGSDRQPRAWDIVNIIVDPARVRFVRGLSEERTGREPRLALSTSSFMGGRVWLKGRVQALRQIPTGWLVSLEIGGANVSALVCRDAWVPWNMMPGAHVDVYVARWEAWIKPYGQNTDPIECRLLYPSEESNHGSSVL